MATSTGDEHELTSEVENMAWETRCALRFVLALRESAHHESRLYALFFEDRYGVTSAVLRLMPLCTAARYTRADRYTYYDMEFLLRYWTDGMLCYAAAAVYSRRSFVADVTMRLCSELSRDTNVYRRWRRDQSERLTFLMEKLSSNR